LLKLLTHKIHGFGFHAIEICLSCSRRIKIVDLLSSIHKTTQLFSTRKMCKDRNIILSCQHCDGQCKLRRILYFIWTASM